MVNERQENYTVFKAQRRRRLNQAIVQHISMQHSRKGSGGDTMRSAAFIFRRYLRDRDDKAAHVNPREQVFAIDIGFHFNRFSKLEYLFHFRCTKKGILHLLSVLVWPINKTHTIRNRYGASPILAAFIILRRLAAPARWRDYVRLFAKWPPHLSEIFWESIKHILESKARLILNPIDNNFLAERASKYAEAI